jgi:hypothetical protein
MTLTVKKLNWFEYYFGHCFQTGWREVGNNFKMWRDLLSNNYADYALLSNDDPYEECYSWFWSSINMDETFPKEFLEYLMEMCDRIDRGEEKLIPMTEDFMDDLKLWAEEIDETLEELSQDPTNPPVDAL